MRNLLTSIQKRSGLNVALLAISMNIFCVDLAHALSLTYIYRGNNFVEFGGDTSIFSTNDRVTAQFTIDCAAAHSAGNCSNLPYDNYAELGAVKLEPHSFSAGPASLPTSAGNVEITRFSFSTDSRARIVYWDMDLILFDPSGPINVDTDNGLDSAAALGGGAVVVGNPGDWTVVAVQVAIDIKPGNKRNVINPRAKGGIWVAILSDTNAGSPLDPSSQIDIPTVEFGPDGAKAKRYKVKDINKDGIGDLLLRFKIPETGISCGDGEVTLTGETIDGQGFIGTDSIDTVGCEADKLTYTYRGNSFEEVDGLIFTTNDRVTAQFSIDCAAAHSAGDCSNLPYDNYVELGAVKLEPHSFSAGPASLPTSAGNVEITRFSFSTDSSARIVYWDMDLFLFDPSGPINVDTDNGLDSAAALGGGAVVVGNPGDWRVEKAIRHKVKNKNKDKQKKDKKDKIKK